jgi:glycine/D-amino acid oxidase-like deaminating enzyme
MANVDAVVVGGGMAGLSAAYGLLRAGVGRVRVLEREPVPCAHSSGRNAAIFRHLSLAAGDVEVALRSRALLDELLGGEEAWLRRTGMWLLAETEEPLAPLFALAERHGLSCARSRGAALFDDVPALRGGGARYGLFYEGDGVIDTHAVTQALLRAIHAAGGEIAFGAEVASLERDAGRVAGVRLASGERIEAAAVVIAAGAWAFELGAAAGAPRPLEPRRRHLVQLEGAAPAVLDADAPVLWQVGDEIYARPESGGVLACPCDEHAWKAELPAADPAALELLSTKLARFAPPLADASVRRSWAGLRTFTPDRAPLVGPDPEQRGLYWLAGLGGHGMTGGLAAGELLAATVIGAPHPLAAALDPARFSRGS